MQKSSEIRKFQKDHLTKAPLATFDTIDLGDDIPKSALGSSLKNERPDPTHGHCSSIAKGVPSSKQTTQSTPRKTNEPISPKQVKTLKNIASKDSNHSQVAEPSQKEKPNPVAKTFPAANSDLYCDQDNEEGFENYVYISHIPATNLKEKAIIVGTSRPTAITSDSPSVGNVPPKLQAPGKTDSPRAPKLSRRDSFSSSSSDSDSEVRRVRRVKPRKLFHVRALDTNLKSPVNLYPEFVDPSSITSPSKRKAYEKRLQRLQVKTSPIARPRSTTPINVVTLDEYVVLSSPERSPCSPNVAEKLKITLPPDEFSLKPRSPRKTSYVKTYSEEDSCFEFNEELLFSRTRSALLVSEDGKLPDSPKRVLIPPTISPSSSPKLIRAPRQNDGSPKLVYIQSIESPENDNWATFPDTTLAENHHDQCQVETANTDPGRESTTETIKIYANNSIASDPCDIIINEDEEIITINIEDCSATGKRGIDIVLSSSGSSNIPSPSSPDRPPVDSVVPSPGKETGICGESLFNSNPGGDLAEDALSSSSKETYL